VNVLRVLVGDEGCLDVSWVPPSVSFDDEAVGFVEHLCDLILVSFAMDQRTNQRGKTPTPKTNKKNPNSDSKCRTLKK